MFYHITPDPYKGDGFVRAEIGLHRDANAPGSAGCIVVTNSQMFNGTIVPYLAALRREQKSIDLAVEYK
jgi:predicted metal-dependent RNase